MSKKVQKGYYCKGVWPSEDKLRGRAKSFPNSKGRHLAFAA